MYRCDICGDTIDTVWFLGVCRCRNVYECSRRAPWEYERVFADRKQKTLNEIIVDFFARISETMNINEPPMPYESKR